MKTLSSIAFVAFIAACTADQTPTDGGKVICANTGQCISPDFWAACYHSGALVPVQLDGGMLVPVPISARAPDGGSGRKIPANPSSLLFTDSDTVWFLDNMNAQIDLLDVGVWPPNVLGSIATGNGPWQLLACDGMVISINSGDNTIQGIDPQSHETVNEVNVGDNENPYLGACDGQHTFYVTNFQGGDVKSVDLSTFHISGTFTIPQQDIVADPDGGTVIAAPQGIAFYPTDAGGEVFFTVASLVTTNFYTPAGQGSVVATDALLLSQRALIGNGAACVNPAFLVPSQDGTQIIESCGGSYSNPLPSEIARIRPADLASIGAFGSPFSNPARMAMLKNGLVAVVDGATAGVAVFNPNDGGLQGVYFPCPVVDGGAGEIVSEVAAAQ